MEASPFHEKQRKKYGKIVKNEGGIVVIRETQSP